MGNSKNAFKSNSRVRDDHLTTFIELRTREHIDQVLWPAPMDPKKEFQPNPTIKLGIPKGLY